jgi:hypothetical protein
LKETREIFQLAYKGNLIKIISHLSAETLKARRTWNVIFSGMRVNNYQPRLLCPAELSFKTDGEINTFQDNHKLEQFITNKPEFQKILKGILHTDEEESHNMRI